MKRFLIILPILIVLFFSTFSVRDVRGAGGDLTKIVLDAGGMTCPSCPATVKVALKRLDGVVSVDVSYLKGTATVEYQEGKVTPDQMISAIKGVGYRAKMTRHP